MRVDPANGVVEVGGIVLAGTMQRTPASHRGDVPAGAPRLRRARLPQVRVEVRLPQRALRGWPRPGSGSPTRAGSATRWSTRAATATPTGSRSPTTSGRGPRRPRGLAGPGELRRVRRPTSSAAGT
jgi:hypothetical protein